MVEKNDVPWRLYLAKGDPDVFVDKGPLEQHHIDGIRSMYRLFEKKKTGIILNDQGGTGRTVQTVLFINAIRSLLKQPVLILCSEGREEHWLKQFRVSSNFGDGVVIEQNNPLNVKASVYIHPMHHISAFCKREWGLLVVDDNVSKEVFRSGIKAHFRIWITSADMKENLEAFSQIFKWLYPKDKFCIEEYQANKKSLIDKIRQAIMLEAFMEDIVIRRRGASLNVNKKPEVSRKNKDATGTKIKRTKRKPDINPLPDINVAPVMDSKRSKARNEDTEFYINVNDIHNNNETGIFAEHKNNEALDNNNSHKNHIHEEVDANAVVISIVNNEIEKSAAETKIVEQLLKTSGSELKSSVDREPNSLSPDSYATEIEKSEAVNLKNIEPDKSELNSKHLKENVVGKIGVSVTEFDTQKLLESESVLSQCIVIKYDSDTPGTQDITTRNQDKQIRDISVSEDMFSTDILPNNSEEEIKFDEIKNKVDIEKNHDVPVSKDMVSDILPNENVVQNESYEVKDYKNELDVDSKSNVSENDKTDTKCDTSEDSLDSKMKKLEELTLKKFKGSFLDFMF